jgi:hypothetical protein
LETAIDSLYARCDSPGKLVVGNTIRCCQADAKLQKSAMLAIVPDRRSRQIYQWGEAMNIAKVFLTLIFFTTAVALMGCTSNVQYRTNFPPYDPAATDHSKDVIESDAHYQLGFVEFDDQGWDWCPRQRKTVEQMIRTQAGLPSDPAAPIPPNSVSQGIVLVAFVHGWKDNAQENDYGVDAFKQILTELNEAEVSQKTGRKVVGVYCGWRGLSATWEPFKELSIFGRYDAAHKVGGYGALTQLFVELEKIQKDSFESTATDNPHPTELIIIGHSLGAGAVYSALSQIINEKFVNTIGNARKQTRLKPLGDQVILLNPAFEAVRYHDLNEMVRAIEQYPPEQRPVLTIFTSKGDWATHYVFPIYRFFSTFFDSDRDNNQQAANRQTVGWFKPFATHDLHYQPRDATGTFNPKTQQHELPRGEKMAQSIINDKDQGAIWDKAKTPQNYQFDDALLEPVNNYKTGDPFLIVSVDSQIMADHNDIADVALINFIREYLIFCHVDPPQQKK